MFDRLFRRGSAAADPMPLYIALVEQSRRPEFYGSGKVPDTLDGRFDMVCLHVFLALRRLKSEGLGAADFAQRLFDAMFLDMDRSLREIGVGDMGVGPKVKTMAKSLYGRIAAYDDGLAQGDAALAAALTRNLYGTVTPEPAEVARVAAYLRAADAALAGQSLAALESGAISFPAFAGEVA